MEERRLRSIAIVGGGVAGWMAAASLARLLKREYCRIVLVESPQAASPGNAETTVPAFQRFHNLLGIDESDFVRATRATFKLGVAFTDWSAIGQTYFHTFGEFGGDISSVPFHHYWLKLRQQGERAAIEDYSMATVAAKAGRFARPSSDPRSPLSLYSHAYHFDAAAYADYLKAYSVARGVTSFDQTVVGAELRSDNGHIGTLVLSDGRKIEADFFIDCTGFPGFLSEQILQTGCEDWGRWLPCDRAVSLSCAASDPLPPFSRVIAREAGWMWRVPLQDRTDCGYLYGSRYIDDDHAGAALESAAGNPSGELRFSKVACGRPKKFWNKNCLALPGVLLEPLEATNIHLIQTGILKLFAAFPDRTFNPADSEEYNRLTAVETERIRDFLILHYCSSGRDDSAFWRECRAKEIPDALYHKIALFRSSGRVNMLDNEHFAEQSWLSLFLGHGVIPQRYDPLADIPDIGDVRRHLNGMAATIDRAAQSLPTHREYLSQFLRASRVAR